MAWTFVKAATTIKVQNPIRSNLEDRLRRQALSRSASGACYVYDKGTTRVEIEAQWTSLRDDEKDVLQDFFDSDADGMVNTFTLTDHEGNSWTARFLHDTLEWEQVDDSVASSGSFCASACETSGETAYPTTTRSYPIWAIRLRLEVA